MALASWPTGLPDLRGEASGFGSEALYTPPKETAFDDGPPRTRRRQLFDITPFKVTLELKFSTLPTFLSFVKATLNNGAARFTGPVLLPDGTVGTRTCKIKGAVSMGTIGRVVPTVSFTLLVWDWQS